MKKIIFSWGKFALVFFLVILAGCNKLDWDDLWHKHNSDCQIKKITYYESPVGGVDVIHGYFNYNRRGQPTSVVFDLISTGRPNMVFMYDEQGRLTDFVAPYNNNYFEVWHKYQYDQYNRIVADTQYSFGYYIDSIPSPDYNYPAMAGTYHYDNKGRVIMETREILPDFIMKKEYVYNSKGNISAIKTSYNEYPPSIEYINNYDNKVNIASTNPLWMFLEKNYSKNNWLPAASYNSKGLPTSFNSPGVEYPFLHAIEIGKAEIEYRCR